MKHWYIAMCARKYLVFVNNLLETWILNYVTGKKVLLLVFTSWGETNRIASIEASTSHGCHTSNSIIEFGHIATWKLTYLRCKQSTFKQIWFTNFLYTTSTLFLIIYCICRRKMVLNSYLPILLLNRILAPTEFQMIAGF